MARALVYFALVFGVGCVLGPIRVLWLAPRVGERWAELLEAPLMLVAIYLVAGAVVRRFPSSSGRAQLGAGLLALALLLTAELGVVLGLRGLSLRDYIAGRDPLAGAVYAGMLLVFAAMPWVRWRRVVCSRQGE